MKPVYVIGKIIAILGSAYTLYITPFDLNSAPTIGALSIGLSALGSLFEKNVWVNTVLGFVTKYFKIPYTPDPPANV